jgi:hypothetical protein
MYQKNIERNWSGIQFEKLRKKIDPKFNNVHDELSDCYYNKKPFRTFGILTKDQFDKLHGLIFLKREVEFHQENLKQAPEDKINEDEYRFLRDEKGAIVEDRLETTQNKIAQLKAVGFELEI